MAKSFNSVNRGVPGKQLSELDFLDLIGEPVASVNSLPAPVVEVESVSAADLTDASKGAGNMPNTGVTGNSLFADNPDNPGNTSNEKASKRPHVAGNLGNTLNPSKGSNKGKPGKAVAHVSTIGLAIAADGGDVRQTFVISRNHLEQLRDMVHARRTAGDYAYSQKQAMQEALDLLFATNGLAAPRSHEAREREQQHRELAKKGRQSRTIRELPPSSGPSS
jgi:hypothetical protein